MKIILWATHYLPYIGGLEVQTHALARQLYQQGHEILVFANHNTVDEIHTQQIENINVIFFPFIKSVKEQNLLLIKKILQKINQELLTFKPDLINVHGWFESFAFFQVRILEKSKLPVCITVHGLLEQIHYKTSACLKLWSMAKAVNTVSHALIQALKQIEMHHQNIKLIHNGLPALTTTPAPVCHDPPILVMAGRLSEEKCFDIAFMALAELIHKYPQLKLILVGGGHEFNKLSALKHKLKLDAYIEMTDFVRPDKVADYLAKASIVLVPSYYESFGLVALEAAMCGRPVIASNVHGLPEVVAHEETGLLIEPKNPQALAKAIDSLLSDPQRLHKMGQAARTRAEETFSIEKTTHAYIEMYQKVMGQ